MATNFPTSLDSLTNPAAGDSLSSPSHSAQHANVNDAVEALQAKVGVDGSAVTGSLDYKVANQGLVLVKSQTIGSGVSSVTVTGAFSSTFENYRVVYWVTSSVNQNIEMTISGETSATGYDSKLFYSAIYVASGWTSAIRAASDAWNVGYTNANVTASGSIEMYRPYANLRARFSSQFSSYVAGVANGGTVATSGTQSTGFTLAPGTGTFTGGQIRVYGYNDG
jgi:hypothetical protein